MEKRKVSAIATFLSVGFAIVMIVVLANAGVPANYLFAPFFLILLVIFLAKVSRDEKAPSFSVNLALKEKPKVVDPMIYIILSLPKGTEEYDCDDAITAYKDLLSSGYTLQAASPSELWVYEKNKRVSYSRISTRTELVFSSLNLTEL